MDLIYELNMSAFEEHERQVSLLGFDRLKMTPVALIYPKHMATTGPICDALGPKGPTINLLYV